MTFTEKEKIETNKNSTSVALRSFSQENCYFRNIPRKMWRVIYPAKEFIGALSFIFIMNTFLAHSQGMPYCSFFLNIIFKIFSSIHSVYLSFVISEIIIKHGV